MLNPTYIANSKYLLSLIIVYMISDEWLPVPLNKVTSHEMVYIIGVLISGDTTGFTHRRPGSTATQDRTFRVSRYPWHY